MTTETVRGTITSLAFGGEGILRHEGYVYFIPYTTVGDQIRARVIEKKARFGRAVVEEIEQPGPDRQVPRCPYFGTCGGCQLQHIDAKQQINYKAQWLTDSLERIGKLPWKMTPRCFSADPAWYYRRHVRLTLMPHAFGEKMGFNIGYQGADHGTFVPVQQCALFLSQEDPLFIQLGTLLKDVESSNQEPATLVLMKLGVGSFFCRYAFSGPLNAAARAHLLRYWQCDPRIVGMSIETPEKREVVGKSAGSFSFDGLEIAFSPFAFVQAHPTQSATLYREVEQVVKKLKPKALLDLYCGIGVTSLIGACNSARVVGIEGNPDAIACAKENGKRNGLSEVEFLCADVAKSCSEQLKRLSPDLVLVNPPRTGIDHHTARVLLEKPPKALLYISCMPSTLARDLVPFAKKGFLPRECAVVDLFPQTTHMETLLLLERKE